MLLLALAATALTVLASPAPYVEHDYSLLTRDIGIDTIAVSDILAAFQAQGVQPNSTTWNGESYDEYYDFDTAVWDAMAQQLATSLDVSAIAARQNVPQEVLCVGKAGHPFAYAYTLSAIVSSVCAGLQYGAHEFGRTQIVNRTGLRDINGNLIKAVFRYTLYTVHFASVTACTTALTYAVSHVCDSHIHGNKGAGTGTRGAYVTYDDGTRPELTAGFSTSST